MNTIPRPEYPRPDFVRQNWQSLNGEWEFCFDENNTLEGDDFTAKPFETTIQVPFCYQSKLSGIGREEDCDHVWYRRSFNASFAQGGRTLLHFGAVDYAAKVWLNGVYLGGHVGGHTPFYFDVTACLRAGENLLVVKASDHRNSDKPRGKQSWTGERFGCWYTPTTGIWQPVWLERAGDAYLTRVKITPDVVNLQGDIELFLSTHQDVTAAVKVYRNGEEGEELFCEQRVPCRQGYGRLAVCFGDYDLRRDRLLWSPEHPNLIEVRVTVEGGGVPDVVDSYFGLRSVGWSRGQLLLNEQPYYQRLVLDQGYWPDSLLTPPTDEALRLDVELAKQMGFNGARKHQKPEDPRYYYWADKLGLLVWGEMPSAYNFNDNAVQATTEEFAAFIGRDYNHPSIVAWVPVNESWGVNLVYNHTRQQAYCKMLVQLAKTLDSTRFVSANDGWEQVGETDICAVHDYSMMPQNAGKYKNNLSAMLAGSAEHRMLFVDGEGYSGQPVLLTEFGGIAFADGDEESWGYFGKVQNEEEFLARLGPVVAALVDDPAIAGFCYTQLTDVMQETNGLTDPGRKPKINPDTLAAIFARPRLK